MADDDVIDLLSSDDESDQLPPPPAAAAAAAASSAGPAGTRGRKRASVACTSYDLSGADNSEPAAAVDLGCVDLASGDGAGGQGRHELTIAAEAKLSAVVAEAVESFVSLGLVAAAVPEDPSGKRQRTDSGAAATQTVSMKGLMALSASELRQRCRKNFVSASGTKPVLAKRLMAKERGHGGNWAAGTGFGGVDSMHASDQAWCAKSETAAQQRAERKLGQHLQALRMGLPVGSFAPDIRPVLRKSSIRAGIAALIRNSSLLDMADCRREVFTEALEVLVALANHAQGKDVLVEPLDSSDSAQSLRSLLLEMQAQAKVFLGGFKASANEPERGGTAATPFASSGEDEHGMMNGLTVALHIQTVAQLMATIPLVQSTRGTAESNKARPATQSGLAISSRSYTSGGSSQPAAAAAASGGAAHAAMKTYCIALKDLQLDEAEGLAGSGHSFCSVQSQGARGSRLLRQVSVLATSLPLDVGSSVFVRYDSQHLSSLRACISGPAGTPYEKGLFFFDIFLPSDFPAVPPKVKYLTTGAGRVRFNPNLYENGKVCLSLLGTWSGPGWIPNKSSLIQVLISIQSLILVEQPYFNEPSFEVSMGTPQGTKQSDACVVFVIPLVELAESVKSRARCLSPQVQSRDSQGYRCSRYAQHSEVPSTVLRTGCGEALRAFKRQCPGFSDWVVRGGTEGSQKRQGNYGTWVINAERATRSEGRCRPAQAARQAPSTGKLQLTSQLCPTVEY